MTEYKSTAPIKTVEESQAAHIERLQKENEALRKSLEHKSSYIRTKVNQLLDMMGTLPLRTEELDDTMLVEFDPLGIICESFRHVLSNLHTTNRQLNIVNEETKAIFAAAEVGILHIDKNKRILSHNNKLKEFFLSGKNENDIVGHTCLDLICEGGLPEEGCSFNQIIQGGGKSRLKNWAFKDHIFDVIGTPVLDQDGLVDSVVLVYHDITELRKSEQQFQLMFRTHGAVMLLVEPESGSIIDANISAENFYGYSRETLLSMNISDINILSGNEIEIALKNTRLGEKSYFEFRHKVSSGDIRTVEVYSTPITMQGTALLFSIIHDITARKQAEEERQENLLFIEELLKNAPVGIRVFDGTSGGCLLINQVSADIAGGDVETMKRQNFRELDSWHTSGLLNVAEAVLSDGSPRMEETEVLTSFGKQVSVEYIVSRFIVKEKPHLLVIGRDITVEKQLEAKNRKIEAQMLHVQKLESLGVLAGGIAHDFNNILLAILGNAELALMRLLPESPARNNLQQIEKAAQRAADLAQQMLAYSGRGHFVIERLDINAMITEMSQILEVSVSKKAAMRLNLADNLPFFKGDATQIRQIIMNLVINASDAIGDGNGVITITTGSMNCDRDYLSKVWVYDKLEEGVYTYFEITDTGCGMDQKTMVKIFDPFFSTKFTGRGLGMAAVLGIVRGHHGAIAMYSELGKGTSFKVFLPAVHKVPERSIHGPASAGLSQGSGTILLVDDEETILSLGKDMLEELGYRVLTAVDGIQALDVFKDHKKDILCVILDLTMPRLDGEQTFRELQRLDPNVKVIMSSGYNEREVTQKFLGKGLASFIQKPYKLAELSRKLGEIAVTLI